jgi:monovalent cation/hydrogen antiporter
VDFHRNKRPIGLLSVGLVVFTTVGVGLLAWWLLPVPPAAAFACGAVVAPPDAVAATSVARRAGMPRRVVSILEGESLVNDATALVCLRLALAGSVGLLDIAWEFVLAAGGGLLIGLAVGWVLARIRSRIADPVVDGVVSLLTPWLAYLPAEQVHASGVLAVVVAGLLLGHLSPTVQSGRSRIFERTVWTAVELLLEGAVFLLIGLQLRSILAGVDQSSLSRPEVAGVSLAVLVAVVLLRLVWMFPSTYVPRLIPRIRRQEPAPPWQVPMLASWAGMRGVVTLAAAFLLPPDTPERELLVLIAFVVTAGTLLVHGTTLPWMVRVLGLSGPDPAEDHLQEASVLQRASSAGLRELDEALSGDEAEEVVDRLRRRTLERAESAWERLGNTSEPPSLVYARLRERMLGAERAEVVRIRDTGTVAHEVLREVMTVLDIEESLLARIEGADSAQRTRELTTPGGSGCEHLRTADLSTRPNTPAGCEECLRDGTTWVHLRMCLGCGHVGCCDSSPQRHATAHFDATQHPVVRSFETGEAWRWCFVDEELG